MIGHLKSDHRLNRNYLKGFAGDQMKVLLAAAAFNFKKWMRLFYLPIIYGICDGYLMMLRQFRSETFPCYEREMGFSGATT